MQPQDTDHFLYQLQLSLNAMFISIDFNFVENPANVFKKLLLFYDKLALSHNLSDLLHQLW